MRRYVILAVVVVTFVGVTGLAATGAGAGPVDHGQTDTVVASSASPPTIADITGLVDRFHDDTFTVVGPDGFFDLAATAGENAARVDLS